MNFSPVHTPKHYDIAIIGGGFYGCIIAEHLARTYDKHVLLIEKEDILCNRASFKNQSRVHNGYHYPRSILTALRSRVNFQKFVDIYQPAIEDTMPSYYAVSAINSKVTANQFRQFMEQVGAPISFAPNEVRGLFSKYIEEVFTVTEYFFNIDVLRMMVADSLVKARVDIRLQTEVIQLGVEGPHAFHLTLQHQTDKEEVRVNEIYNCTYALLNNLLVSADLPLIPLKQELTELAIVRPPVPLDNMAITVMCGPFFSLTPFPSRNAHCFTHVRYTPHHEWTDTSTTYLNPHKYLQNITPQSNFMHMYKDTLRFLPALEGCIHLESLYEIKTILPQNEGDDGRPILFLRDYGVPGLHCIMGGKIDNIFDILRNIDTLSS